MHFLGRYGINRMSMQLYEIKNEIDQTQALALYFYNDNCQPCLVLRPKVKDLIESKFPKMDLHFINSVNEPELNAAFNIFSNPVLLVFFEGKEYIRKSKYMSVTELEDEIGRIYTLVFE